MEARSWFRLLAAPEGAQLEALLDFAVARRAHYPTFLLVERHPDRAGSASPREAPRPQDAAPPREPRPREARRSPESRELFAALEPGRITSIDTDRWPSAQPGEQLATVSFFHLNHPAARALARVGSLAAFAPPLPEDLSILANDKTPWLVCDSRRRRYCLHLTADEERDLPKALPWLALAPESKPPSAK